MTMPSGTSLTHTEPQGQRCDCCWQMRDLEDIGTLRMPLRRPFRVCKDCVNFMWHARHPEVNDDGIQ